MTLRRETVDLFVKKWKWRFLLSAGVVMTFLAVVLVSVIVWSLLIWNYAGAAGRGDFAAAIQLAEKSINLAGLYGQRHNPFLLYSVEKLGTVYEARRKYPEALSAYQRQLDLAQANDGPQSVAAADALVNVGRVLKKTRKFAEAETPLRQALALYEAHGGPFSQPIADTLDFLAWAVGNQEKFDESSSLYQRELDVTEHLYGKDDIHNAMPLIGLGWVLDKKGQYQAASPLLDRAYNLIQHPTGKVNGWLTVAATLLANIYRDHDQFDKAKPTYEFALYLCENTLFLPNNLFRADVMLNYAKLLKRTGDNDRAMSLESSAKLIRAGGVPPPTKK
jgi:tetratricopeptide (TPR) repeat protein